MDFSDEQSVSPCDYQLLCALASTFKENEIAQNQRRVYAFKLRILDFAEDTQNICCGSGSF